MLTLYFAPGASSTAPHIVLHEIGVRFDSHPISLAKKEQRSPTYLAMRRRAEAVVQFVYPATDEKQCYGRNHGLGRPVQQAARSTVHAT